MRRSVLTLALLGLLALPSVADAAVRQIIHGAGFGHGIGMSQYGAYGYARHGYSYRYILAHYYTGTTLSSAGSQNVRVLLQTGSGSASFSGATSGGGHRLNPARTYRVRLDGLGGESLFDWRGKRLGSYGMPLDVRSSNGLLVLNGRAMNGISGGHYRGSLEFQPSPFSGLAVVNVAGLDDYVKGVVPGEMPASWSPAALEAQAVAARSYALATDAGGQVFDQYPDTRSQVYQGADGEQPSSNAAVDATAGQVLRYNGQIAATYFFSTSGGRTENIQNVFYGAQPQPYLVGVRDPYDNISPRHRWTISMTTGAMQRKLRGFVRGRLRGIKVLQHGYSPRIVWALVVGTRGSVRIRGVTLRNALGLYDTWASFNRFTTKQQPRVPTGGPPSPGGGVPARQENVFKPVAHTGHPARLYGSVWPAPRNLRAVVQRLGAGGRWHTVRRTRLNRKGSYAVLVAGAGTFRIVVDGLVGPSVVVR